MASVQHVYKQVNGASLLYAWFSSMHTRVDIIISGKAENVGRRAAEQIESRLGALKKIANYYDPYSELSALNNSSKGKPAVVSEDLFTMIEMCAHYNKLTLGYFDVSIDSDHHSCDTFSHIYLSRDDSSITFGKEGIRLNLSGFVKGYALDEARKILENEGIGDALVNIGNSSVLALGDHPAGNGWKIGIDFPVKNGAGRVVTLRNECLTTSGNHSVHRKHIKSPFSGEYVEGVRGVSAVTEGAAEGEALSTALFAAGPGKASEIIKNFKATVYNLE